MSRKRRSIISYYEPSPSSGSARWIDFRDTTYNTSSNVYVYSTTSNTSLISLEIEDRLHEPRTARLLIKNRPARPFSDDATIQGTQGPWSNTVSEFTKIKIRDGETNAIYFYGLIYDVQDFMDKDGGILSLTCHDHLQEIMDKTTEGQAGYRVSSRHTDFFRAYDKTSRLIAGNWGTIVSSFAQDVSTSDTSNILVDSRAGIEVGDQLIATNEDGQTEIITVTSLGSPIESKISISRAGTPRVFEDGDQFYKGDLPTSRSGLIKSILGHHSSNITFGDNSATSTDERFQDSLVKYSNEDFIYTLSDSKTSILTKIQNLAVEDPHNSTLTEERTFGFDYFMSPNFTDASLTNEIPKAFFNYFKRGTFPSESQRFGTSGSTTVPSNGLFQQGLNVYHPSPSSTAAGSFSETGKLIPMTTSRFSRPKNEIFSAFEVSYIESPPRRAAIDNYDPQRRDTIFMYAEAATITNADADYSAEDLDYGFLWNQENVSNANDGAILLIDTYHVSPERKPETFFPGLGLATGYNESAEFLNVRLKQLNAAIGSISATTISVDSDARIAGFYVGQHIRVNNEIMKITALGDANDITVERGALGSVAVTHSDNDYVEAWHVAKIQYVAKKAAYSSGSYQNITNTGILLSHINPRLFDGDSAFNFDEYWTVGGASKEWIGDESRSIMTLSYTPQNSYSFHRVGRISYAGNGHFTPNNIRERIFQASQRNHIETLRGMVTTYRPPVFYFTDDVTVATGSGTQTNALQLQTAISGSTNPHLAGIKIGITCNQLDGDGNITGVYGYVESVTSGSFTVKWSSGSGVSTDDTIRIDIPVRAGEVVKVKNDLVNVDTIFGITKSKFTEDEGVRLTSYNIVGEQDQKRAYGYKHFAGAKGPEGPSGIAGFGQATITLGFDIRASSRTKVQWAGGPLVYKGVTYEINPGSLTLTGGSEYVLYYRVGQAFLQAAERSIFVKQIKGVITGELISVAVIITESNTSSGEYPRIGLQNHVKGPAVTDTTPVSETLPGTEILFASDKSTLTTTGTIHGSYTLAATTTDDIDVTSLGFAAGERPFYVGQKIVIENEELQIKAVDNSASPKHIDVLGRPSGVSHAAGTAIRGTYRHGRIRPDEISTGVFALTFDTPKVGDPTGVFSWVPRLKLGTSIGTSIDVTDGAGTDIKADLQLLGSQELKSGDTSPKYIYWTTSAGIRGSMYIGANGVLYVKKDDGEITFQSSSITAADIAVGSDAQGDIYYRAASALARLPKGTAGQVLIMNSSANAPEWLTASSLSGVASSGHGHNTLNLISGAVDAPSIEFVDNSGTGFYKIDANTVGVTCTDDLVVAFNGTSSSNGYVYSVGGYSWNGASTEYINRTTGFIQFYSGGANLRMKIGSVNISEASFYISDTVSSTDLPVSATASGVYSGKYWIKAVTSSRRYKSDIQDYTNYIDSSKILDLNVKTYKDLDGNNQTIGLIAEEVEEILPELVSYKSPTNKNDSNKVVEGVKGNLLEFLLLEEIKKLNKRIDNLEENK